MSRHLLILMPYPEGEGSAWLYIERVAKDLADRCVARGDKCTIAFPKIFEDADKRDNKHTLVARNFYGIDFSDTIENAKWIRQSGITHLYFAEHVAFDWRFAVYRRYADVGIAVQYHHAGGRTKPYTGLARTLRAGRRVFTSALADLVICVSQFVLERVVAVSLVPRTRCVAIYNAVIPELDVSARQLDARRDELRNEWGVASEEPVVLSGARASREKGLDTLFMAHDKLCSECGAQNLPLPWVAYAGDGTEFNELNAFRKSLKHGNRIFMLGRVPNMQRLILAADISVLASRCDEAFGLFAAESMQAGLPVIVTNRGGLPEIIDDGVDGYLINSDDVATLTDRMRTLVADPKLRERMGLAGIDKMRTRFGYANMLNQMDSQIQNMKFGSSPQSTLTGASAKKRERE